MIKNLVKNSKSCLKNTLKLNNFHLKNVQKFSSYQNYDNGDDWQNVEDISQSMGNGGGKQTSSVYEYKFMKYNYGFEVKNPVFPLYQQSFEIPKDVYQYLSKHDSLFVTTIMKKNSKLEQQQKQSDDDILKQINDAIEDSQIQNDEQECKNEELLENPSDQNKQQDENINTKEEIIQNDGFKYMKDSNNLISQYHDMGTYCKADLKEGREGAYKMILTGLHRVHIENLYNNSIDIIQQQSKNDISGDRVLLEDLDGEYNHQFGKQEALKNLQSFSELMKERIFKNVNLQNKKYISLLSQILKYYNNYFRANLNFQTQFLTLSYKKNGKLKKIIATNEILNYEEGIIKDNENIMDVVKQMKENSLYIQNQLNQLVLDERQLIEQYFTFTMKQKAKLLQLKDSLIDQYFDKFEKGDSLSENKDLDEIEAQKLQDKLEEEELQVMNVFDYIKDLEQKYMFVLQDLQLKNGNKELILEDIDNTQDLQQVFKDREAQIEKEKIFFEKRTIQRQKLYEQREKQDKEKQQSQKKDDNKNIVDLKEEEQNLNNNNNNISEQEKEEIKVNIPLDEFQQNLEQALTILRDNQKSPQQQDSKSLDIEETESLYEGQNNRTENENNDQQQEENIEINNVEQEQPQQEQKQSFDLLIMKQKKVDDRPHFEFDLTIEAKLKHLLDTYAKIMLLNNTRVQLSNYNLKDSYRILDSLGGFLTEQQYFDSYDLYKTFKSLNILSRIERLQRLMYRYQGFLEQFKDLGKQARDQIFQRKYTEYQLEMFKIAKKLSKGKSRKEVQLQKLEKNLEGKVMPKEIKEIYERERQRFVDMQEMGQEANIVLTFLEWLTSMPYGKRSVDNFDLKKCQKVLDQHHYGMEDIKEKIMEFIAVGKLKGNLQGKIVCLAGPPGVGKTSLAYSIAQALGRKFSRITCGGESDSAFLKGHRKTYIGAYPGKIIQSLKECGTENCVILLDEIDKLGKGSMHGDPQANLLEILDPEQNQNFVDNYLEFKVDLSNVLFICSANITDSISEPLLDRMDVIELSSYTHLEKKQIYNKHLYPKIIKECGVEEQKELFQIPDNIVDILIKDYCREPGIRGLEKYSKKLIEKIAFKVVEKEEEQKQELVPEREQETVKQEQQTDNIIQQQQQYKNNLVEITEENLVKLVGFPKFQENNLFQQTPTGVVVGLAYTAYGGSLIWLESVITEQNSKNAGLKVTGNLGKVMKESMQIAYTFSKNFCHSYLNGNEMLEESQIHIHAPEGAVPKDGPSAGITISSALVSLATNTPLKQGVAMTGEISLRGNIMKIGGVKEKILAAKREQITELIFPMDNKDDVYDLKEEITEGIDFHFVQNYAQAFKILFPQLAENNENFSDYSIEQLSLQELE